MSKTTIVYRVPFIGGPCDGACADYSVCPREGDILVVPGNKDIKHLYRLSFVSGGWQYVKSVVSVRQKIWSMIDLLCYVIIVSWMLLQLLAYMINPSWYWAHP
jgi:hypothetical protein